MKPTAHPLCLLACALMLLAYPLNGAPLKVDSIKVGSQTYNNVNVIRVTDTDLYFNHDRGVANVKLKYLEPDLQKKFDYDPQAAAEAERRQTRDDSLFQDLVAANLAASAHPTNRPTAELESSFADPISDKSLLGRPGPLLQVTKWLGEKPDLKGKALLLFFWAPWSAPCRKAIPEFNALQKTLADKLVIVGLASESPADIEALADPKITFASAIDARGKIRMATGATSIPYVLLLDPKGIVRYQGHPGAINEKKLQGLLARNGE